MHLDKDKSMWHKMLIFLISLEIKEQFTMKFIFQLSIKVASRSATDGDPASQPAQLLRTNAEVANGHVCSLSYMPPCPFEPKLSLLIYALLH